VAKKASKDGKRSSKSPSARRQTELRWPGPRRAKSFRRVRGTARGPSGTHPAGGIKAAVAVNSELVVLYWQIGREILARQERRLGCQGDRSPGGRPPPSVPGAGLGRNLKYMRAFGKAYSDAEFVQQVAAQTWGGSKEFRRGRDGEEKNERRISRFLFLSLRSLRSARNSLRVRARAPVGVATYETRVTGRPDELRGCLPARNSCGRLQTHAAGARTVSESVDSMEPWAIERSPGHAFEAEEIRRPPQHGCSVSSRTCFGSWVASRLPSPWAGETLTPRSRGQARRLPYDQEGKRDAPTTPNRVAGFCTGEVDDGPNDGPPTNLEQLRRGGG
jgi:hypothetical protein